MGFCRFLVVPVDVPVTLVLRLSSPVRLPRSSTEASSVIALLFVGRSRVAGSTIGHTNPVRGVKSGLCERKISNDD